MANRNESRVCRLHGLVVRDAGGYSRAFQFGEVVELTPWLIEALGDYVSQFAPLEDAAPVVVEAEPAAEE